MSSTVSATDLLRNCVIPKSQVQFTGETLGRGAYGKVSEVDYGGKLCAAKEIHSLLFELGSEREVNKLRDDFLRECNLWSTLRHPNVVLFLGVYYPSTEESGLPVIVMEKMQYSVTSLIEGHESIPLFVKLSILHDVCLGLNYLHNHSPPIVHRDLSSNNILLTCYLEAKITDLGVSKVMTGSQNSKTLTKTPGTAVFMPPEALDDKPVYGPSLDIFSLGGVILHIASRQWPIPKSWSQIDPMTGRRILLSEVQRRQQYIDLMIGGDADLKPLVISCLQDDPKLRPLPIGVSERIKTLKEVYGKENTYDGMDSILWLAEIKQPLLPKKSLQVCPNTIIL